MTTAAGVDVTRIREPVRALIDEHHLPGVSVGLVRGDDLVYAEGFGFADIESRSPMTPEHRQRIGSITKTMIGLCAMALVDEGRLALDDRVADHLPDLVFHGEAEKLTIWHLLTHTGGIGEVPMPEDLPKPFTYLFTREKTRIPCAESYPRGVTLEVPPGTKWAYANHGYNLLGEIIARIEGAAIDEVVRRRVLAPLGMRDSDLRDMPHPELSSGYHHLPPEEDREALIRMGLASADDVVVDGYNARGEYLHVWGNAGAGGVQSTIPDMARYASALLRKSNGIVRAETFERMVSPQWRPDARLPGWGLSFSIRERAGRPTFGHSGGVTGGWNTNLSVYPKEGMAVLIHTNIMYEDFETAVIPAINRAVFGDPESPPSDFAVPKALLESAPGVYEASSPGPLTNFRVMTGSGRVQVSIADGRLVLYSRRGPWKDGVPMLLADPAQPDLFVLDTAAGDRPQIAALVDAAGSVIGLRFPQLVDMYRTERVQPWA